MKKVSISLFILFSASLLNAQTMYESQDQLTLTHITVPSPSVASLYKFSDVPVNLSNGSVNISIPIYTIQTGAITWPISLKYNSTGIRVNEHASNIGLGWSIDAEGAVVQTVLGWKDNGTDYLSLGGPTWDNAAIVPNSIANYNLLSTLGQTADGAPDLYVYNLHNQSGKFMITDAIKLMPKKDIEISSYNNLSGQKCWKIVDQSGVVYFFEDMETNQNRSYGTGTSSSNDWLITKVVEPSKNDTLYFEYENMFVTYSTGANYEVDVWTNDAGTGWQWTMAPNSAAIPGLLTNGIQNTDGKQLKRIRFPEGSVEYDIAWNTREDWPTDPSAAHVPKVKNILVKNRDGEIIKTVHFDQSYFQSSGTGINTKRLRLDSVSIADDVPNAQYAPIEKYRLKYRNAQLPPKNSLAIDHWGYYNGKNNNQTLIPSFSTSGFHYYGADRNTDPVFVTAGMLEKITYPTGGFSTFSWSPHVYYSTQPAPPTTYTLTKHLAPEDGLGWSLHSEESSNVTMLESQGYSQLTTATLTLSGGYPANSTSYEITHAAHKVVLYEVTGSNTVILKTLSLSFNQSNNYTKTAIVTLKRNSTYYFIISTQGGMGYSVFGSLSFERPSNGTINVPHYVGGCRIASITTHDINTNSDIVKKYQYSDVQVFNMPVYSLLQYKYVAPEDNSGSGGGGSVPCSEVELPGYHLSSNSMFNMATGNHVGYSAVKEIFGGSGEGGSKTSYFTNYNGDRIGEIDASWRHGIREKEEVFDASNHLISRVEYHNKTITSEHYAGHMAVGIGAHPCSSSQSLADILNYPAHWSQKVYDYPIDWIYTDTVETTDFAMGVYQIEVTNYDNTNHMLPTRVTSFTSDNKKITAFTQYPTDFDITSSTNPEIDGVKLLQDKHMHNLPIETYVQQWVPGSSTPLTLSAKQYEYQRAKDPVTGQPTNVPVLKALRSIDIPGEGISNFFPTDMVYNSVIRDPKYTIKSLAVKYDSKFNIEKLQDKGTESSGYLWGYNGKLTIATVQNLDTTKHIAYTSFENDAGGNWKFNDPAIVTSDFFTGSRCINISTNHGLNLVPISSNTGNVPVPIIGSYILSYWRKNGNILINGNGPDIIGITSNGWTFCEHHLTSPGGITFTGTGFIDELRLYPERSLMKSFTYKPLVGVTSADDESNGIIFYEYDETGRLITEKDAHGNILKSYTYQFQGPQ